MYTQIFLRFFAVVVSIRCKCFKIKFFHSEVFLSFFVVVIQSLSHVQLFATPWTVAHQAPVSMGFPRQKYWSGLSFPSPGDLPNLGIKPVSPVSQVDFFLLNYWASLFLSIKLQKIRRAKIEMKFNFFLIF